MSQVVEKLCFLPVYCFVVSGRDAGNVTLTVPMSAVGRMPALIRFLETTVAEGAGTARRDEEIADHTLLR